MINNQVHFTQQQTQKIKFTSNFMDKSNLNFINFKELNSSAKSKIIFKICQTR